MHDKSKKIVCLRFNLFKVEYNEMLCTISRKDSLFKISVYFKSNTIMRCYVR
jgi:hypothetical protein